MILYIENPKNSIKKPLKLIYEFSKVEEYKINIQKSVAFLYTYDDLPERGTKKINPNYNCRKRYVGINLTKEVNDLYSKNYKTPKKEIREATKWKHIPLSWIGRINIIKTFMVLKAIYRFYAIINKIPLIFFHKQEQTIQKFMWKHKRSQGDTIILRKKNKVGSIMLPNIKLYYKSIVFKTPWYWHKNGHTDQWNKVGNTEINQSLYMTKETRRYNRVKTVYLINVENIEKIHAQ